MPRGILSSRMDLYHPHHHCQGVFQLFGQWGSQCYSSCMGTSIITRTNSGGYPSDSLWTCHYHLASESVWQTHIFHWRDNRFWIEHLPDRSNFVFFGFIARIVIHIAGIVSRLSLSKGSTNLQCILLGNDYIRIHQHWRRRLD